MSKAPSEQATSLAPNLAVVGSTVLWGTLWIPLRQMQLGGIDGATANTASFALCLLFLLPFGATRLGRFYAGGWPLLAAGFCMALSIALYAEGMVRGQVARVILLFYLTPVWSSLLGRLMLGKPITGRRVLTILLGLSGALVIFGAESGLPMPHTLPDWMGLISGIIWALAMVYVNRTAALPIFDRLFVQTLFLAPIFFLLTQLPGARLDATLESGPPAVAMTWLVAFAAIWILPAVTLAIYGGSKLDPGRVAILFMLEIVIGIGTAAAFAGEPFGSREAIGAALIIAASLTDVRFRRPRRKAA